MRDRITQVVVIVPARDEEQRVGACLDAIAATRADLAAHLPKVHVRVMVVLDCCLDSTDVVVAGLPEVEVVVSSCGRVGGARAMGVRSALSTAASNRSRVWIACTDADSTVPSDWLRTQVQFADAGADLLLGTVRPDTTEMSPQAYTSWLVRHDVADGHRHIHGANLGVRANWYSRVGGFEDVAVHEDALLADAVRRGGGRVFAVAASPVVTSARQTGRAPTGFAGYLQDLASGSGDADQPWTAS